MIFFEFVFFAVFRFLIFVQGFSSKVHLQASRSSTSGASFSHSRTRILYKSAHVKNIVYMKILIFAQGFSSKSTCKPPGRRLELRILPPPLSFWFLIKNNTEITPQSSGSSLLHFPVGFSLRTIQKSPPRAPDSPSSIFLFVSY